jgi:hypothetical protein
VILEAVTSFVRLQAPTSVGAFYVNGELEGVSSERQLPEAIIRRGTSHVCKALQVLLRRVCTRETEGRATLFGVAVLRRGSVESFSKPYKLRLPKAVFR